MSNNDQDSLLSIEAADLMGVTGGTNHKKGNAEITAALKSVTDSIKSLNTQKSSNGLEQMLPLLMLAKGSGGCPSGNCGRR